MARLDPTVLPAVTDEHRRAAFEAMRWAGWTYDDAMANATRRQIVETRAHQIRKQEWQASRRSVVRFIASTGDARPLKAHTGRRFWPIDGRDLKRAAAGDLDD